MSSSPDLDPTIGIPMHFVGSRPDDEEDIPRRGAVDVVIDSSIYRAGEFTEREIESYPNLIVDSCDRSAEVADFGGFAVRRAS